MLELQHVKHDFFERVSREGRQLPTVCLVLLTVMLVLGVGLGVWIFDQDYDIAIGHVLQFMVA